MKRLFYTACLLAGFMTASAEIVGIETVDGTEAAKFDLSQVQRIDLTDPADIKIIAKDGTVLQTLNVAEIKLDFTAIDEGQADNVELAAAEADALKVWADADVIYVSGAKAGERIGVFRTDGVLLARAVMTDDAARIDASGLANGIYIVKVGTKAVKIIKK